MHILFKQHSQHGLSHVGSDVPHPESTALPLRRRGRTLSADTQGHSVKGGRASHVQQDHKHSHWWSFRRSRLLDWSWWLLLLRLLLLLLLLLLLRWRLAQSWRKGKAVVVIKLLGGATILISLLGLLLLLLAGSFYCRSSQHHWFSLHCARELRNLINNKRCT